MARRKLVAGNWKMHGSLQRNAELLAGLRAGLDALACEVAVCVPSPYLAQVGSLVQGTAIALGAQDVSEYAAGAYTGEVSVDMLGDFGCCYVLVGHSERRTLFGDSDVRVAAKLAAVMRGGLVPVLCVGETLAERDAGATGAVVERQLAAALAGVELVDASRLVVAYEPVWAIGTGMTATPSQAQAVHRLIRDWLVQRFGGQADGVRLLYGGSVKPENAAELFAQMDIDGGLIGGASLVAKDFLAICQAAV